jgi:hypothetical protein
MAQVAVLVVLASCASPVTRYYVLGATDASATDVAVPAPEGASTPRCRVGIGPLGVPSVVDRPQLVLREGANRIAILEQERWGEPLREAFPRLLAESLRRHVPADLLITAGGGNRGGASDVRVVGEIGRFDLGSSDSSVTLHATLLGSSGKPTRDQSFGAVERATPGDYGSIVAAASRAVDRIGAELAPLVITACGATPPPSR